MSSPSLGRCYHAYVDLAVQGPLDAGRNAALARALAGRPVFGDAVLRRVAPNVVHGSWVLYYRVWVVDQLLLSPLLQLALENLLSESVFRVYLRALGARAGPHTFWRTPMLRAGVDCVRSKSAMRAEP